MSLTLFAEYKNTLSVNADIFNHGIDVQSDLATYPDPQIGGGDLKLIDINEYERSRCSAFIYNDGGLPYELTRMLFDDGVTASISTSINRSATEDAIVDSPVRLVPNSITDIRIL